MGILIGEKLQYLRKKSAIKILKFTW